MQVENERKPIAANTLVIIPARMASTRFPGKPLALISGVPMLQRVWKIAKSLKSQVDVVIATDDAELKLHCEKFGADVVMTSENCKTGMDRAADACRRQSYRHEIIVTLQGDAVLTPPWVVDQLINVMLNDQKVRIATPMVKLAGDTLQQFLKLKSAGSSTGTTVVFSKDYNALYFSKAVIPYLRDEKKRQELYRHIGLYAYQQTTLMQLSNLAQSPFEKAENLEQLRALENDIAIKMVEVDYHGRTHASVDNPQDIKIVEDIIAREGELV